MFENDLERPQQALSLKSVRDRQLLTYAQAFHRSSPPQDLAESGQWCRITRPLPRPSFQLEHLRLEHPVNFFMGCGCHFEHSIRLLKGELGAICGQFNGSAAEGCVQVWVELVATDFGLLWGLRDFAKSDTEKLPG